MQNRIIISTVLILATLAVFWPAHNYGFVSWDDNFHVYENPYLNPATFDNMLHFWRESYKTLYIPFTYTAWSILAWLSYYLSIDGAMGGLNPALFHTANIFLHMLNTLIVFSILSLLLTHGFGEAASRKEPKPPVEIAAGVGALIFAVHPIHVEPVVWVTGMKGLLSGLFSLLALREYLFYAIASKKGDAGRGVKLRYIAASAAFVAAMLSKPVAVVIPLVAFILDRWAINRTFKVSAAALAPWFVAAFLFAMLTRSVHQGGFELISVPLWAKFFIAGDTLAFYLYKLVFPLQLGIDYGRNPDYLLQHWWLYLSWLVPLALLGGILLLKRRTPSLASFGIFAASLFPVLGFVTFLFQYYSTAADRYAYLSVLGLSLIVSSVFLNRYTKPVAAFCLAAVVLFGIRSSQQVPTWQNETALYTNALKVNRYSVVSHTNLGNRLRKDGKLAEAAIHLKKAIKIRPDYMYAHNNLGIILSKQGKQNEAIQLFEKTVKTWPRFANAYVNLGIAMLAQGKTADSIANFTKALKITPGSANAHANLGVALAKQGNLDDAIAHYHTALQIRPQDEMTHINLGVAYVKKGNYTDAITNFSDALKIRPDSPLAKKYLGMARSKQ